jgi:gamma-glutamyltranspeptidase / glutathione hydrolase
VTVPGAVDAWARLIADGTEAVLGELLQPAIRAMHATATRCTRARPTTGTVERDVLRRDANTRALFMPDGEGPAWATCTASPRSRRRCNSSRRDGRDAFYGGAVAEDIVSHLRGLGGLHTLDDFAAARGEYVTPIATDYRGARIVECPPNGQGIAALMMFDRARRLRAGAGPSPASAARFHLQMEAKRLAYAARDLVLADPRRVGVPTAGVIDPAFGAKLRKEIAMDKAMADLPPRLLPPHPDTVYLSVVDGDGTAVSFINSLYDGFGSGLACPDTGVLFQSRGRAFRLDPSHPNVLAPHKRPLHTIIPGMAFKHGRPWLSFGVMGGDYQPVGQVQALKAILDHGMDPQAAMELPRTFAYPDGVLAEIGVGEAVRGTLTARGHRVIVPDTPLGGGQAILIDADRGLLVGGSDPRKDGLALGW